MASGLISPAIERHDPVGERVGEVSGLTSTSSKPIEKRYGHHCPGHMENARKALGRRKAAWGVNRGFPGQSWAMIQHGGRQDRLTY
jgi:hypothetical protein